MKSTISFLSLFAAFSPLAFTADVIWTSTFNDAACTGKIPIAKLAKTPSVQFGKGAPKLTPFRASALAQHALVRGFPRYKNISVDSVRLEIIEDNSGVKRGYYLITFFRKDGPGGALTSRINFDIAVLLDETVVFPQP